MKQAFRWLWGLASSWGAINIPLSTALAADHILWCFVFFLFGSVLCFKKKTPGGPSPLTHGSFTRVWFSSQCLEMFLLSCCDWFCWSPLWSEYKYCDFSYFRRVDVCCMAWGLISLGECSILWIQEHSVLPAGLSRGRLWAGGWCGSPTSGLVFCLVVLWVVERTQWSPRPYLQIGCLSSALSASASCILRL